MQSVSTRLTASFVALSKHLGLRSFLAHTKSAPSFGLFNAQFAAIASVDKAPGGNKQPPSESTECPTKKATSSGNTCPSEGNKNAKDAKNATNAAKDPSAKPDLRMQLIPADKLDEVIAHQRQSFYCTDPLHKAMGICQDEAAMTGEKEYAKRTIAEGMSVMALAEDGKIVAAHLNGMMCPGAMERELAALGEPKSAFEKILYLKYKANLKVNLFEKYGVDAIYEMKMASVDEKYQCPNIGFDALKMDEQIARDAGYKLIKAEASGIYMENVLEKMGFESVSETRYDSVLDKDGKIMVPVKEPHTSFKIMVKKLE